MKAVILAGGLGTRISEETHLKPKPMIEIGGMPIIWHLMKIYSFYGINDFIICCGYKGYIIKEYFANYFLHMSDVTIDMSNNQVEVHKKNVEPWKISLVDTGQESMTGGRLKRISNFLEDDIPFCFTYGDGLSDINISEQIRFHKSHGKLATIAAVSPPGRFGALEIVGNVVASFKEKPKGDGSLINGGFFILSKKCIQFIENDNTIWENDPLVRIAQLGELMPYIHEGFWHAMDTLRDKNQLEAMWNSNSAPWKVW